MEHILVCSSLSSLNVHISVQSLSCEIGIPSDTGVLSRVGFNNSEAEISNDNPKPAGVAIEVELLLFIKELNIFTNGDTFEFPDRLF